MSVVARELTCRSWCADPVYADQRQGTTSCKATDSPCEVPRAVIGWWATDEAAFCRNRCVTRKRPDDWSPDSVAEIVSDVVGDQLAAAKALGRDVAFALAEWTGVRDKYLRAKETVAEMRRVAASLPPGHSLHVRVRRLEEKVAWADKYLAPVAGVAGLGNYVGFGVLPAAAGGVAIGTSAVWAGASVLISAAAVGVIYFLVSETAEFKACADFARGMPPAEQAAVLDQCRRSGWSQGTKVVVGAAAVGVLGLLAWVKWGRRKTS